MSDVPATDSTELKAGHPPAVKVAGMRITQNKVTHHDKPEPKVEKKEGEEEDEAVVEAPPKVVLSVSGAIARGDQDFPASSVKAFHEKTPTPANEFRPVHKKNAIQQPKKM
ncbi:PREDICTED: death-associated protein 1-like [Rhagoletis zephyria]|uniref:death-associated protein 1-like n=1 Tax=Rhagoletis zephyria TaxID=28612 RepID=UPI000811344C|nr:PREDICTED: death-associated protein 1-like [Rhagoletis zephyria]KAH9389861.1 hypothetical protein TYRP_007409 [Tyrophagus putrescentiae]